MSISGVVWIVGCFFFLLPIAFGLSDASGKPIDLVPSDALVVCLIGVSVYRLREGISRDVARSCAIALGVSVVIFAFAAAGGLMSGSTAPIMTGAKYVKPLLAFVVGVLLAGRVQMLTLWHYAAAASVLLVALFSASHAQLLYAAFPDTGIGRWGGSLAGFEVYGFPNSSASFLLVPVMFLVGAWTYTGKSRYLGVAAVATVFMVMSLSRAAAVVAVLFYSGVIVVTLSDSMRRRFVINAAVWALVVYSGLSLLGQTDVAAASLRARVDRTLVKEDPTSGRLAIAAETLDLVSERPYFGYLFESFDKYHVGHSTPHNQYLESLFKTGGVGFTIYYVFVLGFLVQAYRRGRQVLRPFARLYSVFIIGFGTILICNLVQPNFTYSMTGNVLFLMLGYLATQDVRSSAAPLRQPAPMNDSNKLAMQRGTDRRSVGA
jgi:O-antigen ligase